MIVEAGTPILAASEEGLMPFLERYSASVMGKNCRSAIPTSRGVLPIGAGLSDEDSSNQRSMKNKKLIDARTRAGLRQPALAEAAGVSITTISRYENGLRRPHVDEAQAIAKVLGVSVSDIFPVLKGHALEERGAAEPAPEASSSLADRTHRAIEKNLPEASLEPLRSGILREALRVILDVPEGAQITYGDIEKRLALAQDLVREFQKKESH